MTTKNLQTSVLALLRKNARISVQEMADSLDTTVARIEATIKKLEADKKILGYTAITAPDEEADEIRAIIEVQVQPERDAGFDNIAQRIAKFNEVATLYLVSGSHDLHLEVVGHSLQDVARFVSRKLSSQPGVKSCATLFLLKKYKESGIVLDKEEGDARLKVTP